jgi:hypothetical protein
MHLADYGIARHATQRFGDLTGGMAFLPELLQGFYPFVSPAHALYSLKKPI